ncbi:hypothetical protein Tsubulata_010152 [Turnera subulata]|uniref:BHLH domain-containing protein n=1 Tax=Turnera subulata TaxID=218843 RepID=A0A9Q0G7F0_9ROSI|nr:hypothetical protein Tsubulata_010152 [Turnera subulata]
MYQQPASSSSSSPQRPSVPLGLTRYGSAPGAFLARAVDSVIAADREYSGLQQQQGSSSHAAVAGAGGGGGHHYFSADSSSVTSESTCKVNSSNDHNKQPTTSSKGGLQRSCGLNEIAHGAGSLVRQRSSPAGFLSHLAPENVTGFTITNGSGGYNSRNGSNGGHPVSRLKSQLSFTRQDSLSHISEDSVVEGISSSSGHQNSTHSYPTAGFTMEPWENANSFVFSGPPSKQARTSDGDIYSCFNALENQLQATIEMGSMDKLLNIPEDSVPCKIRAKRGCATHPRSIAERERRTRISGKLKKLQELVPNMDKQTSYADMLDLAVQHIRGLQNEVQVGRAYLLSMLGI